jgi:hypothetical protein
MVVAITIASYESDLAIGFMLVNRLGASQPETRLTLQLAQKIYSLEL